MRTGTQPYALSLAEASRLIGSGELTPLELTESVLARIDSLEPHVNAFATVTAELALQQAQDATREIRGGARRGPLHGIPIGIKDLIDTAGTATASGSRARAGRIPDRDAAVASALREAGAVMVGKTHTHEFAVGAVTPATRNPWDPSRIAGGSSGGSAAAVAYGGCTAALGTDTGGSIRIPAALCGTVGLKPTYGRVPTTGVTPLSWSLDHVGPLTRTVTDAALVLNAIAGQSAREASGGVLAPDFTGGIGDGIEGLRIGIPQNFYNDRIDPETTAAVAAAVHVLKGLGAVLIGVRIPCTDTMQAAKDAILLSEAAAYHRHRPRRDLYGEDARALLSRGEAMPAIDYIDALRTRAQIREAWKETMRHVDVVIGPTVPTTALAAHEPVMHWPDGTVEDATTGYVRLSMPANLTGFPSLQVPCGFTAGGLPIGMQIIGKPFAEGTLLRAGRAYERAVESHGGALPLPVQPPG